MQGVGQSVETWGWSDLVWVSGFTKKCRMDLELTPLVIRLGNLILTLKLKMSNLCIRPACLHVRMGAIWVTWLLVGFGLAQLRFGNANPFRRPVTLWAHLFDVDLNS